jgi:DNA topoisomerase-1
MDLPKSKMGIDMEHGFAPQLEVVADKKKIVAELRAAARGASAILLATDPDREGEAISANIQELLTDGKGKIGKDKFKRIVFHEITEEAIKEALESPRQVDRNLVDAQIARRVLDRLVGYQLSPMLWRKVRRGLSAGRVQSVALRLLVEREREIEKFGKEPYFTIHAILDQRLKIKDQSLDQKLKTENKNEGTEFSLIEINGEKIEVSQVLMLYDGEYKFGKTIIDTKEKADALLVDAKKYNYVISEVNTRESKRSPYPPFTTSTLQQQAASRLGMPGKRTMSLAQKLYEEGFITYHRTDSVILSPVAVKQMRAFIQKEYGDKYVPEKSRSYFTKQKNAQEAHEAIRPTRMDRTAAAIQAELGEAYVKLYDLIRTRAIASQMTDARIESTSVFADSSATPQNDNNKYRFKTTGSVLIFDGFLKLTPQALEDRRLPMYISGEKVDLREIRADAHETNPPPRYNDASLIKTLEEKSIGRPSTYASIISTITDRGYIERVERKFVPTSIGVAVTDFLVKNFATIDDVPFTAAMEDELDRIANGEKEWHEMMSEFYEPFAKSLKEVEGAERVKIPVEETDQECPECKKGKLVVRTGKFGKFLSCSRFPECKFTKQYVEETKFICPKDGGKIIVRKTRKGRKFYGCSNYPKCDFAAWKLDNLEKTVA